MNKTKQPTLVEALIPILFLVGLLSYNVFLFGDTSIEGPNQIALLLSASVAAIIAARLGINWDSVRDKIVASIGSAMPSILILLIIGSLSGTWLLSGVVPMMIYYGLQVLHPTIFLFAAVIICAITSLVTGSSWTTIATLGVALLGIGQALGFDEALVAGAIISGAYFGDKMSPLSDTTNLAPAMAGTDLFTHIRYMMYTTVPSIVITLVIFLIIGFLYEPSTDATNVAELLSIIKKSFNINPVLLLVPFALFTLIMRKVSPLPALMAGTLLGGIFAVVFQHDLIYQIGGKGSYTEVSYIAFMKSMFGEISIQTSNVSMDKLLHTRGMTGMLNTVWLIMSAMVFGGVMESAGLLKRITLAIITWARSTGSLVGSTVSTCLFFNVTASDQYLAIVVPGRMFAETYKDRDLKPEVLSRTLEDSATVTSVLIPWNTCGATQSTVLGVSTFAYAPYAFFNIISPIITTLFAYLGIKIRRLGKRSRTGE